MAKKNKVDGTPIEFYIPGPGKRDKVPIPINQPNWMYKTSSKSKPTFIEWFAIAVIIIIPIGISILLIASSMYKSPLWMAVIAFGIYSILLIGSAISRLSNDSPKDENVFTPKAKETKLPKRPKNYK